MCRWRRHARPAVHSPRSAPPSAPEPGLHRVPVPRRLAAITAAALLLASTLAALTGCGSGSGQLHVSLSGEAQSYQASQPASYSHYRPGEEATFTVAVVNTGPGSVTGVTVHVTLPPAFRYHATTSIDAPGATRTQPLDAAGNSITPIFGLWTLPPPGAAGAGQDSQVIISFNADVRGQPGAVTLQAYAAGDTDAGQTNATAYNVVVDAAANVTALVTASPASVKRGSTVTYEVRVINSGTGNAQDIGVLITLPPVMPTERCGSVPRMNSSLTLGPPGEGRRPVHGSTSAVTSVVGSWKSLIAQPLVASAMKPCQTKVDTSIEKTGFCGVETTELSELPFHTPTARACSPAARAAAAGGAMNP